MGDTHEIAEVCGVRRIGGGRGLCGGPGKIVDAVFPGRPQRFRYQRRQVDDCMQRRTRKNGAERRNKGRNIKMRNGSLPRTSGLDYSMQSYART